MVSNEQNTSAFCDSDDCDSWCEGSGCESGHCDQEGD